MACYQLTDLKVRYFNDKQEPVFLAHYRPNTKYAHDETIHGILRRIYVYLSGSMQDFRHTGTERKTFSHPF